MESKTKLTLTIDQDGELYAELITKGSTTTCKGKVTIMEDEALIRKHIRDLLKGIDNYCTGQFTYYKTTQGK